tara:strand:+ start:150 stop:671 length:522 start_codon:yes stop_codon:yes gene_type:complete
MKINLKIVVTFLIASIILILFFLGLSNTNQYNTKNLIGKKLSEFNLQNITEESNISNIDLSKNEFTLINFWASWCSPCRKEHEFLLSLNRESNLKILGINFKDKKNNARNFLKELGNPYHLIAKDDDGSASIIFGIYGIPESILVNNNLRVLKKYIGPINHKDYKEIISLIKN